jgi:hypothetical protein
MAINIIKVVTIEISINEKPRCATHPCLRCRGASKENRLKLPIKSSTETEKNLVIAETPKQNRNQQKKYRFVERRQIGIKKSTVSIIEIRLALTKDPDSSRVKNTP